MLQNYPGLRASVDHYRRLHVGNKSRGAVQKLTSTPHLVCLQVRYPGKTEYLYLGRGAGHEGLWASDAGIPAGMRVKDPFLEYLRHHLGGAWIEDIQLDPFDRILSLAYSRGPLRGRLGLFWCGRSLYFANAWEGEEAPKLLVSWKGGTLVGPDALVPDIFSVFEEVGRRQQAHEGDIAPKGHGPKALANYFERVEQDLKRLLAPSKKLAFMKRKVQNIQGDLSKLDDWEELMAQLKRGELDVDGANEIKMGAIRVKFALGLGHYQRVGHIHEKYKAAKQARALLEERLKEALGELQRAQELKGAGDISQIKVVRPAWRSQEGRLGPDAPKAPVEHQEYVVHSLAGAKVGVGLSAKGNDALRSQWASKDDTWFHIDGEKSAHAIVKLIPGAPGPTEKLMLAVGCLLKEVSKYGPTEIPLMYTQVKNIKGIKGRPGSVIHKKTKYIRVHYSSDWKAIISAD